MVWINVISISFSKNNIISEVILTNKNVKYPQEVQYLQGLHETCAASAAVHASSERRA